MTENATFVINGAERVVVSQLARSPGVYFKDTLDFSGRQLYYATLIPNEGAWVDIETDAGIVGHGFSAITDPPVIADEGSMAKTAGL